MKKKILFLLHLPGPIHGASLMGQYLHDSEEINARYDCRWVSITLASSLGEIQQLSLSKVTRYFRLLLRTLRYIIVFRPDLIYLTPNSHGRPFYKDLPLVLICKMSGRKVLLHFHNKGVEDYASRFPDRLLYRWMFRDALVMLLSPLLEKDLSGFVPHENVTFCANGIPSFGDASRNPSGRILFLSNLLLAKGCRDVLLVAERLKADGFEVRIDVYGAATPDFTEDSYRREIALLGVQDNVFYHGPLSHGQKAAVLSRASVLYYPTYDDCFPLVLIEALQAGLPVVASMVGGISDIVSDGENGILTEMADISSQASALKTLLFDGDRLAAMSASASRRFMEKFTIGCFERRFLSCLEWAINRIESERK